MGLACAMASTSHPVLDTAVLVDMVKSPLSPRQRP